MASHFILSKEIAYQKIQRMAYEIAEQNINEKQVILAGIRNSGVIIARILHGYLKEVYRGKIVIIEIDSSFPPEQPGFNKEGGSSYYEMVRLGIEKGYFLLCHSGNMIFVDNEYRKLFLEIVGDGIENANEYFKRDWVKTA